MNAETNNLPVVVTVEPYAITCDYNAISAEVEKRLEPFRNAVFDADSIQDAKKARAELNGLQKAIARARIDNAKKAAAPIQAFEQQMKSLEEKCGATASGIDKQIREWTDAQLAACRQLQAELVSKVRANLQIDERFWRGLGGSDYPPAQIGKLTKAGGLTSAAHQEITAWVNQELAHQDQYEKQKVEVELASAKAGLHTGIPSEQAEQLALIEDSQQFQARIQQTIKAMVAAQKQAEEIGRQREREEAERRAREEAAQKEREEAAKRRAQQGAAVGRAIDKLGSKPDQETAPKAPEQETIKLANGLRLVSRNIVFALPESWDDERIDQALEMAFAARDFKSFVKIA